MPRDRQVEMSQDDLTELLDAGPTVTSATIGPDGRPHRAARWFARQWNDLVMWTYAASQKARNLQRDGRATVLVEAGLERTRSWDHGHLPR